jgi:transforming growth factor-beta-induced protein
MSDMSVKSNQITKYLPTLFQEDFMRSFILVLILMTSLLLIGCSEDMMVNNSTTQPQADNMDLQESKLWPRFKDGKTIVDIASSDPNFSVLVQAVVFAGLDGILDGRGQYTVFAPTNQAFVDLLGALGLTPEQLFVDANKELVRKILKYHVAPGERFAKDVLESTRIRTFSREFAYVQMMNNMPQIGNPKYGYANIVATDIDASNGVIHVLDKVIIPTQLDLPLTVQPTSGMTIVDIAASNPDFSILVAAVQFAGLQDVLSGKRQYTVFAPTNQAFVDLLAKLNLTPEELFVPANKELVKKILLYHVAPGERFAADVISSWKIHMLSRDFAKIDTENGVKIGNSKYGYANIIATDIDAKNGVIHVLDAVILPPSLNL